METPPAFELRSEIDLIFAMGKALHQVSESVEQRPWLKAAGMNPGTEKQISTFIADAIIATAEKAKQDLETPPNDAESE